MNGIKKPYGEVKYSFRKWIAVRRTETFCKRLHFLVHHHVEYKSKNSRFEHV